MLLKGVTADMVLKHDSSLLLLPIPPMVILEGEKSFATIEAVLLREMARDIWLVVFEIITGGFAMPCICRFLR